MYVCMCCHSYRIRDSNIHTDSLGWIRQLQSCWNTNPEVTIHLTLYPPVTLTTILITYVWIATYRKLLKKLQLC